MLAISLVCTRCHRQVDPAEADARADGRAHDRGVRAARGRRIGTAGRGRSGCAPAPRRRGSVRLDRDDRRGRRRWKEPRRGSPRAASTPDARRVSRPRPRVRLAGRLGAATRGRQHAERQGVRLERGDRVQLWLGDGTPATPRVVAHIQAPTRLRRRRAAAQARRAARDQAAVGRRRVRRRRAGVGQASSSERLRTSQGGSDVHGASAAPATSTIEAAAEKQALAVYVLLGRDRRVLRPRARQRDRRWQSANEHASSPCSG